MFTSNLFRTFEKHKWHILSAAGIIITFYLFWNTGIHGDDYTWISEAKERDFGDFLSPKLDVTLFGLPSQYLFWWAYQFLDEDWLWVYDVVKWLVHVLSVWLVYRFAADYLPKDRAFLAAVLFIFNPVHETTAYWYMTIHYVFTPALIMYAHHLVRESKFFKGLSLGILGAFMGYVSPPYTFGLSIIFLMEKAYKKAVLFLLPGVLYVIYYFSIAALYPSVEGRLNHSLSLGALVKNYIMQIFTFLDSAVGPSFLFKIWWAIRSIELPSLLLALVVVSFMMLYFRSERGRIPISMFWGLVAVLLLSFGMFSLTGLYSQMAFNLGNRVTIYGSLFLAFLIASLPLSRKLLSIIAVIFVIPVFGLSDHWKSWNAHQKAIIYAIRESPDLSRLRKDDILLVAGNMYSRLGPFSYIEFFSMPWAVNTIFKDNVRSDKIMVLPPYVYFDGKRLVDAKYGGEIAITGDVYLYQSGENRLTKVSPEELPGILVKRPPEIRHWIQWIGGGQIRSAILELSPRLGYLFK